MEIDLVEQQLQQALSRDFTETTLEKLRREWLGTNGIFTNLFKTVNTLEREQKIEASKRLNQLKSKLQEFIAEKRTYFSTKKKEKELAKEWIDLSLPSNTPGLGAVHPIRLVERTITSLLIPFGFQVVDGPEVESEYYCFDALNIPKHHPARDMQDTFYIDPEGVLRTHTTSVQARELEKGNLPVRIISCGRAYRNEAEDSSHQSMFHQYELVWIEKGLTLSHLMALLAHVLHGLYGKQRRIRFVPKYYPYTEPSLGAQIDCTVCSSQGCSVCKESGWVTIVGAGMIHENVLKEFHYDPHMVSGLAFGFGTSRLASQLYNLPNIKSLYTNDLRQLRSLV